MIDEVGGFCQLGFEAGKIILVQVRDGCDAASDEIHVTVKQRVGIGKFLLECRQLLFRFDQKVVRLRQQILRAAEQ